MPQAIKIGRKASRISPALAAQMAAGAVVSGAPSVEETETAETEKTPEEIAAAAAALAAAGTKEKTPEQIAAEAAAAAAGAGEEEEVPEAELSARITELETNIATLNTQLTTAKGVGEHVQAQLNTANQTLGAAKLELKTAQDEVAKLKSGNEGLRKVVMDATSNLSVAFSTEPPVLESLDDVKLAETYTGLRTRFNKAFVTGRRTAGSPEVQTPPENLLETDAHPAASAATKVTSLPSRKR